jgi:hypothetical protein
MADMRNAFTNLVGKPGEKRPFRRFSRGWEDNMKLILVK